MQEKAYKLLALQEKISNNAAKELIDKALVSVKGVKIELARTLLPLKTKFEVSRQKPSKLIFEDDKIIAVNKAEGILSEELQDKFKAKLLNRLDKETSGVLMLCRDEALRLQCIEEFKKHRVEKTYVAVLNGIIADEMSVDEPILTLKIKGKAFSKVDKRGLQAHTTITPLLISGKKTLAKIEIPTGRTHQIRVHCAFMGHGVVGDTKYARIKAARMYLHSLKTRILDYEFFASLDESFNAFDFELKSLNLKDI